MREWPANHPKAKLMARNRLAIVNAARTNFLRQGYAGTGMEAIAAAAGVSIMTLYRHAESKDDLFAAVIEASCRPDGDDHRQQMDVALTRPLVEVLTAVGNMFEARLFDPQTLALFRTVMVEGDRFPQLGALAYRGFVGVHVDMLDAFLAQHPDTRHLDASDRRPLADEFLGSFVGLSYIAGLLRASGQSDEIKGGRTAAAVASFMARLAPGSPS